MGGHTFERFTRGVGLAGDMGTLVAATHHTGSWTNGTFYAHHNHRGDIVLTRSGTTTVGQYDYTAFGSLKSQTVWTFAGSNSPRRNGILPPASATMGTASTGLFGSGG
jgi:hypothetical protein